MVGNIKIRQYMRKNIADHVDQLTGEVNDTSLAEDAFWALDPESKEADVPKKYFECAHDVASEHEIKTGVKEGRCLAAGFINSIPGGSI